MQTKTYTKKEFLFSFAAVAALALILTLVLTACSGNNNNHEADSAKEAQVIKEGESLVILISDISETAKFYPVKVDGTNMEVVAVKASDGTNRTAFNTCQVCNGSPKAYFEQIETTLECQNCKNKFPMDRVEVEAGGCNPIPIFEKDKTVTDDSITIGYDTLKANKNLFPSNWKK